MIKPYKYMNLDLCLLNVAAEIVVVMKHTRLIGYDELLARLQSSLSDAVRFEYILALDFLFLMDIIEYSPSIDSFLLKTTDKNLGTKQ